LAFRNDEPSTAAVCASLEDGHNDTSHVLSLLAVEEENTQVGLLTGEEGVQEGEEENTQVGLITGEEGVQEVEEENTQVGLMTAEEDVQEVEEEGTQVGVKTGEEGVQEDAEFNQFMDWIIEEMPSRG
jgi:hypothetical protein